jgi:hypothetical protein
MTTPLSGLPVLTSRQLAGIDEQSGEGVEEFR